LIWTEDRMVKVGFEVANITNQSVHFYRRNASGHITFKQPIQIRPRESKKLSLRLFYPNNGQNYNLFCNMINNSQISIKIDYDAIIKNINEIPKDGLKTLISLSKYFMTHERCNTLKLLKELV